MMSALLLSLCGCDETAPSPNVPTVVASFDAAKLELPESVFVHAGTAYLSFINGSVVQVAPDGMITERGKVEIDPPGSAYAEGVAVDGTGNVYVAMTRASAASTFAAGVYKIPLGDTTGTRYASNTALQSPQDVALDAAGNLYVTDGATGTVFKLTGTTAGTAAAWKHDALLEPAEQPGPCGQRTAPFPIGADSIVVEADRALVANLERASLIAIAIAPDGSAGAATALVVSPADLCGIDGLARHADGGSYLAVSESLRSLLRIGTDGSVKTLYEGMPFLQPTGVDVGQFGTTRQALIASPDFIDAFGSGGPGSAKPTLFALPLPPR
jgi:sugar lactone lactonase YvrE